MKKLIVVILAFFMTAAGLFFSGSLNASSSDAWEEFRTNVKKACLKLAPPELKNPSIAIDDYGSESYGIAVLQGIQEKTSITYVCIYDKKTEEAELSGQLDLKKAKKFKQ